MDMEKVKKWYLTAAVLIGCFPFLYTGVEAIRKTAPFWYELETTADLLDVDTVPYDIGEITKDVKVQQTFTADCDSVVSITVMAGAYARKNSGPLCIRLIDVQTQEVIKEWEQYMEEVHDPSNITVGFEKEEMLDGMRGKTYLLELTAPQASEGNAVTLYALSEDKYEKGSLWLNEIEQAGDLRFRVYGYLVRDYVSVKFWLCLYGAVFLEIVLYILYQRQGGNREKKCFCSS